MSIETALVEVQIGVHHLGPLLLPAQETASLGRDPRCGLRVDEPRLSAVLATFDRTEHGWIVTNGTRTRMTLAGPFVVDAVFAPGAKVLLQPADWTITWDLDVLARMSFRYRREPPAVPTVHDRPSDDSGSRGEHEVVGTLVAGAELALTPLQRRRLAALFAYLIDEQPKPVNVAAAASRLTGDSPDRLLKVAGRIRDAINAHRDEPIETLEDLGYHLVHVAGVVGPDDVAALDGGPDPHHPAVARPRMGPDERRRKEKQ